MGKDYAQEFELQVSRLSGFELTGWHSLLKLLFRVSDIGGCANPTSKWNSQTLDF